MDENQLLKIKETKTGKGVTFPFFVLGLWRARSDSILSVPREGRLQARRASMSAIVFGMASVRFS